MNYCIYLHFNVKYSFRIWLWKSTATNYLIIVMSGHICKFTGSILTPRTLARSRLQSSVWFSSFTDCFYAVQGFCAAGPIVIADRVEHPTNRPFRLLSQRLWMCELSICIIVQYLHWLYRLIRVLIYLPTVFPPRYSDQASHFCGRK